MQWIAIWLACGLLAVSVARAAEEEPSVERGRYIAVIGGCNDCHTPGYAENEGNVPESEWLKGDSLGYRGPWGTTYPTNLRSKLNVMSEDDWVEFAKTFKTRPPMPWFNVNALSETDLRSFYRFVTSLEGEIGKFPPAYVPPIREPEGPFILFPSPQ